MINKTKFTEKYISGQSSLLLKNEGIKEKFDLVIFSCGWESRSTEIINYDQNEFQFDSAAIISFNLSRELGYRQDYMNELKCFINNKTDKIVFIEHDPTELEKIREDIKNLISELVKDIGRPIVIGFDITCCPRFVFLFILGYCLRNGLTKKISFFYSEGIYETETKEYVHTKGRWRIIEIPEFEARDYKLNKRLFTISAGWEGSRYRSLVAKYEPNSLAILLPNPGFTPEYTENSRTQCRPLIEEYHIDDNSIISAPAGDAIAAWKALNTSCLIKPDYHIAYLTFGPKPHALGMGVHGLLHDSISVIYRIPDEYIKIEVKPNGQFWQYDIKNLTII